MLFCLAFLTVAAADTPTIALVGDPAVLRKESARLRKAGRVLQFSAAMARERLLRTLALRGVDLVLTNEAGLREAVDGNDVAGYGRIPAQTLGSKVSAVAPSPARREFERRARRTPEDVAKILQKAYGHEFPEAVYVPGMSLIGRIRIGEVEAVAKLAEPFASGARDPLSKATGSHLAGHLVFAELAQKTGDPKWTRLVRRAADLGFVDGETSMRESMPFHNEMSDAMFMGTPLLSKAAKLTGDRKYLEMAVRQFRFVQALCRRADGIYRHSPLSEAAWGRGNAFALLGLALTLEDFPREHPGYGELLAAYRSLARSLAAHQDADGMWHQVITIRESYPEFSATAMIGRALLLGVRNGWLDEREYAPRIRKAWTAMNARISESGDVVDVCESTGKQTSEEAYLQRKAILGHDQRGGGMAFLFALDMHHFLFQ